MYVSFQNSRRVEGVEASSRRAGLRRAPRFRTLGESKALKLDRIGRADDALPVSELSASLRR